MQTHSTPKISFRRELSLLDATMIGVGAMTGASIFILAGTAIGLAGPAAIIVILLNALVTLLTALGYAEMGASYPEAGGGYLWVKKSLPKPFDFVSGWISWFGHTIACAFYTVVFAMGITWLLQIYHVNLVFPYFEKLLILAVVAIFTTVNIMGTKATGKTQTIITLSQVAIIIFFVLAGVLALVRDHGAWSHYTPFIPNANGIFVAMGVLFIAFEGYEIIAQSAEEVRNPQKNIPRAILLSIGIVSLLYVLLLFALLAILPVNEISALGESAVIQAVDIIFPKYGTGIMILGLLVGTTATLNATIYSSSRVSFAMGRDGTFPAWFGRLHPKMKTPYISTLISAVLISSIAIALPIYDIVASADIMFLLLFILANISLLLLRYGEPNVRRPFRVPLFPVIPLAAIIAMGAIAVMLYQFSPAAWYIAILWIEVGAVVHYFTGGKKQVEKMEEEKSVLSQIITIDRKKFSVHVCVPPTNHAEPLVELASRIARQNKGMVILHSVIEVPNQVSLKSVTYRDAESSIKKLEKLKRITARYDVSAEDFITVSHNLVDAITDAAEEYESNIVVLGWKGRIKSGFVIGTHIPAILKKLQTDAIVYKPYKNIVHKKITLINKLGSDMSLALRVVHMLAKEYNSKVEIYNVVPEKRKIKMAMEFFASIEESFKRGAIPVASTYIKFSEIHKVIADLKTDFVVMNADEFWDIAEYLVGVRKIGFEKRSFGIVLVHAYKKKTELNVEEIAMMHHI